MKTLVLNNANLVSGTSNTKYRYVFPQGGVTFDKEELALASISMYYSWPNITASYNNNSFSYTWTDGTVVPITMPDGFYDVESLNAYLQAQMVANYHYLVSTTGDYVYFLELLTNTTYYSVQFNSYPVYTSGQSTALGYSLPSGATWSLPSSQKAPQITIPSNNFTKVIGFAPGSYPPSPLYQSTIYSIISTSTPQVTPVSAIIMCCDLLSNRFASPESTFFSFAPSSSYGEQMEIRPSEMGFIDLKNGQFTELNITFYDQSFGLLPIKDSNIVIQLFVRKKV